MIVNLYVNQLFLHKINTEIPTNTQAVTTFCLKSKYDLYEHWTEHVVNPQVYKINIQ